MNLAFLPLLLLAVPIAEIGVFIAVGQWIGIGWTLLGILVTAVVGTIMLRRQGLALVGQARSEVNAGRVPARELADGVMLLAAGIMLLTPGYVTDAVGFALLLPPVRAALRTFLAARVQVMGAQAFAASGMGPGSGMGAGMGPGMGRGPDNPFAPRRDDGIVDLDADEYTSRPRDER